MFKEQLEDKAGMKIQSSAAITQRMVRLAGMVTSRYIVGKTDVQVTRDEEEGNVTLK